MSKEKYTFEALMKKKAPDLEKICDGLGLSTDGNKTELSNRILAEEARLEAEANMSPEEKAEAEAKAKADAEAKAKADAEAKEKAEKVVYTLPEKSVGVLDTDGKRYSREQALKNQPLLAKLKKLGHRGIKIKN